MKIKNILLGGLMIVVALSSCSKDSDGDSPNNKTGDARLTISLQASGAGTKADNEELSGEANINNVSVLQFNESGSALQIEPYFTEVSGNGSITLPDIPASSGMAKIVIVTNTVGNPFANVTSYSQMQALLAQLADQKRDNLTMSSEVISTVKPLVAGDNYLGYSSVSKEENINNINTPLEVTRLAARLDLNGIYTDFSASVLEGRTVRVEEVSVINTKTSSHFFSEGYWGVVMDNTKNYGQIAPVTLNRDIYDGNPITGVILRGYVMENDGKDLPTQLRVRATLLANDQYLAETKTFTATVNLSGVLIQGVAHKYVKRNHVYRLTLTFGKNSFDPILNPMAELDVKVEVVAWGPVTQDVEIE